MSQETKQLCDLYAEDDHVSVEHFGRDHWSTLLYVECVATDCQGFQVGLDPRMRSNRRTFRMLQSFRKPKRAGLSHPDHAIAMSPEHGSRLCDGSVLARHDDWCCIQDLAHAGMLSPPPGEIELRVVIHLTDLGREVCSAIRKHKEEGGGFATFHWPVESKGA